MQKIDSLKYRPEIDGLRALAILSVVVFHLGVDWLPGGYLGVDIFFVISGFLITSIVHRDMVNGVFSFPNFWKKRFLRIMPALLTMLAIIGIVGHFIVYAPEVREMGQAGLAALFSIANIHYWLNTGNYWGSKAEDSPLLHTWSLSVEEQFYLFYPLILLTLFKLFRNKIALFILAMILVSFFTFIYGAIHHPTATFYLLPTRVWELGAGCLLALKPKTTNLSVKYQEYISLLGLTLIIASFFLISGENGISPLLCFPVLGAIMVIHGTSGNSGNSSAFLRNPCLVYIGKISYSLYLWHWPIIVFMGARREGENHLQMLAYAVPLMFTAAVISYHFIENKTRYAKKIPFGIMGLAALVLATFSFQMNDDREEDISKFKPTVWKGQLYSTAPQQSWLENFKRVTIVSGVEYQMKNPGTADTFASGGIIKKYGGDQPEIVVLGDSHSIMWGSTLDSIARELGMTISFYCADGTATFFPIPLEKSGETIYFTEEQKYIFDKSRLSYLESWKPKLVVIAARWSTTFKDPASADDLLQLLGNQQSKVLLLSEPPELPIGTRNAPQYLAYLGIDPGSLESIYLEASNTEGHSRGENHLYQLSQKYPFCSILDISPNYLKDSRCLAVKDQSSVFIDDNHLSDFGAWLSREVILNKLKELLNP